MNRKYPSDLIIRKSSSYYLGSILPHQLGKCFPPNIYNSNSLKGSSHFAEGLFRVPLNVGTRGRGLSNCFAFHLKRS